MHFREENNVSYILQERLPNSMYARPCLVSRVTEASNFDWPWRRFFGKGKNKFRAKGFGGRDLFFNVLFVGERKILRADTVQQREHGFSEDKNVFY